MNIIEIVYVNSTSNDPQDTSKRIEFSYDDSIQGQELIDIIGLNLYESDDFNYLSDSIDMIYVNGEYYYNSSTYERIESAIWKNHNTIR